MVSSLSPAQQMYVVDARDTNVKDGIARQGGAKSVLDTCDPVVSFLPALFV